MDINIKDKTNFGWFYGTHKRITRMALKDLPNLRKYQDVIEEFVQRPDFDEQGIFNNWHFFSPIQQKSFFDFKCKGNAVAKYEEHVKKILENANKNINLCIEHTGRALHFLQDMTQPHHTQKSFFFNKIFNLKTHLSFEKFVKKTQNEYFESYITEPFKNLSFKNLIMENIKSSSEYRFPTTKNRYIWDQFGRKGIHQAIFSTKEFLTKIDKLISNDKQYKLPF